MIRRNRSSFCAAILLCAGAIFVPTTALRAQSPQAQAAKPQTPNPQKAAAQPASPATNAAPADFTGVWYPSTGSTLGAATPDNPGQQFVWLDAEGKPLKGPLPLTAWGQERLKANHPTGPKTSAIDSDDPDFQCFPSACRGFISSSTRWRLFTRRDAC